MLQLAHARSVRLDQLSGAECRLLTALGNEFCNSVWAGAITAQTGWKNPLSKDDRKVKEEWIKSKYMWRGFIDYKPSDGQNQEEREAKYNIDLYKSASISDLYGVADALAKGAK